jgi:hypothetical protein
MEQKCVPERRRIKFRRLGIAQKKEYNIQNFEIMKNYFCFSFNLLEPTGYLMNQHVYPSKIVYSTHILFVCFVSNSEKQRLCLI